MEMFLGGDILIEILEIICRYHRYSETIADRQNTIEKFLGGKREKTVGGHLSELGGTSSWRKTLQSIVEKCGAVWGTSGMNLRKKS